MSAYPTNPMLDDRQTGINDIHILPSKVLTVASALRVVRSAGESVDRHPSAVRALPPYDGPGRSPSRSQIARAAQLLDRG